MRVAAGLCLSFVLGTTGCSSSTGPDCSNGIEYPGSVCLDITGAELAPYQDTIESEVVKTLEVVNPLLGLSNLRISVIADPAGAIPEIGLGGFNPSSDEVRIFVDYNRPDLDSLLQAELLPMLAHEMHHAARRRTVGYGSNLFEAAISEGLADHFSLEVSDRPVSPWSIALTEEQLEQWTPQVTVRNSGPYNHDEWFFGTGQVPRWTGYAVGYALVQDYLHRHPGALPSNLVDEPAASFQPPGD